MMARRKRSSKSAKMEKSSSSTKQNRPVAEENEQMQYPASLVTDTNRSAGSKQVWKQKYPCLKSRSNNGHLNASVSMKPPLTTGTYCFPHFQSADQLADWVFNSAVRRPIQLNLCCEERINEVRDALLQRFYRWPDTKITRAVEQYQKVSQEAKDRCQYQVKLYIEEIRGTLQAGAKALFWLNVLQPMIHSAPVSRQEVREVLLLFVEELRSIDGVYEQLTTKHERIWDCLTLPLKLEPLFEGVATLALCGHEIAATEAMQLLTTFAEQNAAFSKQKRAAPIGLSVVASVGLLHPLGTTSARELPKALCEQLLQLFIQLLGDWCKVVDKVLDIVEKSLTNKWLSCERALFEEAFENTVEHDLQSEFARLRHALATNQLYMMRNAGAESVEECLDVSISRGRGLLLLVQLNGGDQLM